MKRYYKLQYIYAIVIEVKWSIVDNILQRSRGLQ